MYRSSSISTPQHEPLLCKKNIMNSQYPEALHSAAQRGDTKRIASILEANGDINFRCSSGKRTAIHVACGHGQSDSVRQLVDLKADITLIDEDGFDSLMVASDYGSAPCVKILLEGKANVKATNKDGEDALMLASEVGSAPCVEALLDANADVKATDNVFGFNALMKASRTGSAACVAALLRAKADVKYADNIFGFTALMRACLSASSSCIEALISANADVNAVTQAWKVFGQTALMFASESGNPACVEALLRAGADAHAVDQKGMTALMFAANHKREGLFLSASHDEGEVDPFTESDVATCVSALLKAGTSILSLSLYLFNLSIYLSI